MMLIYPSRRYELSQLCGVNKAPLQLPGSGQCAHSFGVKSPPSPGAQHRGMAPSRCRHDAADRAAKAASDGFALVETERGMLRIDSACRRTDGKSQVDGSWSGSADDLFVKDELPDHTAESAKDIILNNATSLDATLSEDRYKQNLRKLETVRSIHRYVKQRRLTSLVFGKILGRARHLGGCHAFNGSNEAEIECRLRAMAANWSALRGCWFCTFTLDSKMPAYASSPDGVNPIDKKVCRYLRALSKGKAYDCAATGSHGRSWTNAQLLHQWKVLPARAEVAGNDGAQARTPADNSGNLETASRQTLTAEGFLAPTANPFAVAFSEDLHLFAGLSGTEDFFET